MGFLKKLFTSRVGIVLYALNFGLQLFCVMRLRGITAEEIDAHPLQPLFFLLTLLNYLALLPLNEIANYFAIQPSNLRDAVLFAIASLPWLFVGFCFEAVVRRLLKK